MTTPADLEALRDAADHYDRLLQGLHALRQLEELTLEHGDLETVSLGLLRCLSHSLHGENFSFMFLRPDRGILQLRAVVSNVDEHEVYLAPSTWRGKEFALGEGIAGYVAQTGNPVNSCDAGADARFLKLPLTMRVCSLLCMPLMQEGQPLGVLNISHRDRDAFGEDESKVGWLIAQHCSKRLAPLLAQQQLMECEPMGVLVRDSLGRIQHGSQHIFEQTGRPPEDLLTGKCPWSELVAPGDRAHYEAKVKEIRGKACDTSFEYLLEDNGGMLQHVREHLIPMLDDAGQIAGTVSILQRIGAPLHSREHLNVPLLQPPLKPMLTLPETPGADGGTILPQGSERVLLVDDEELVRNVGAAILRRLGYDVLTAHDGLQAVAAHEQQSLTIDLTILDISMPHLDGHEAMRQIRAMNPWARIIFTSGDADALGDTTLEDGGPNAILKKPYQLRVMAETVRGALDAQRVALTI